LSAVNAKADTILNYQITGPGTSGAFSASFTLPQDPRPSVIIPSASFAFTSLLMDVNGNWTNLTVVFDNSLLGGGVTGVKSFYLLGPQLFSWPSPYTPVMKTGTFDLWGGTASSGGYYTVSVSAVPESNSLVLLGIGGLILCGFLRRR
jgi:hypothetical protein